MDKILLFIPMYNCEKQIIRVLKQLNDEQKKHINEIIIINNRSTDNGESLVKDYILNTVSSTKISLLRNDANYGLGGSHKVAFDYAITNDFDYIIVLHGDDQGSIENITPYINDETYKKYDCFLGARFKKGSKLKGYSAFRTFGNIVYNIIFSIVLRNKIYDLGSGLNMYKVESLKTKYYMLFPDGLMFNYCMVMALNYYKFKTYFFPIEWREDDQVSNVKMVNQAFNVLKMLFLYAINKKKFINRDNRIKIVDEYTAKVIQETKVGS